MYLELVSVNCALCEDSEVETDDNCWHLTDDSLLGITD